MERLLIAFMDLAKAFLSQYEDPQWLKKLALAGLISLIPVLGWFLVFGWMLDHTKRVIERNPVTLPDIDFETQLSLGWKGFVVSLVYVLPIFLVMIPLILIMGQVDNGGSSASNSVLLVVFLCMQCLIFLYAIVLSVLLPAAFANMVAKNRLSAGFNLLQIFALFRAAPLAYLMVFVASIAASTIATVGLAACLIGVVFTTVYAWSIQGILYGQAYNEAELRYASRNSST